MVHEILPVGAENAVPGKHLARCLDLDLRELTKQIERERQAGKPICAVVSGDDRGYFLAEDPIELALYCKSLDRRLRNIQKTRRAVGATLARMVSQEEINWGD